MHRFALHTAADVPRWDAFVPLARNGTFLHARRYMDYHADRFADASVLVSDAEGTLVALLPAHRSGGDVVSHGGLTFGGLLMDTGLGAQQVLDVFGELARWLRAQGAERLLYKPVPHLYHRLPAEDDLYALQRLGARCVRMDLSSTIDFDARPPLASRRQRALRDARRAGLEVRRASEPAQWAAYWELLGQTLSQRHGVAPTHTLDEMLALAARCPEISLHGAWAGDRLLAGSVAYRYGPVLHAQYLAASAEGRDLGALDAVIVHLLDHERGAARWFSLGASTHDQGRQLNAGLVAQKEMFGGRSTVLQTLELDLGSAG